MSILIKPLHLPPRFRSGLTEVQEQEVIGNQFMNIVPFSFRGKRVRFVGTAEKPEWVANDLVEIFYPLADKRNRSNYLKSIPAKWKGHKRIMTPGGMQTVVTLFEPGLYRLINRSDSPLAEPFQDWLYEDVLPTIRKTGQYSIVQNSAESYLLSLILDEPRKWEEHFDEEWRKNAERLTSWSWDWRCMSGFINATVYSYFPNSMRNRLNEVNPLDENGYRPNKQHQHFEESVDEKALKRHIDTVLTLMQVSVSMAEFWRLMNAKFSGAIQLRFDDMEVENDDEKYA